jgi:hypothetical protein
VNAIPSPGTVLGTFAVVVGVLWLIAVRDREFGFDAFCGGLLVIGGLLIRIDAAIRNRGLGG